MVTSRDDFSIAIRSAFLKKGIKQKFSLLALIIASIILLSLETVNSKSLNFVRSAIKDAVYRISFVASIPVDSITSAFTNIQNYFEVYEQYEIVKSKLQQLENQQNQNNYLKMENDKLKKIIDNSDIYNYESVTTKVLVDKKSPFLKSVILNKGFDSGLKRGMPVLDGPYFVGRITEVNYLSSRALLINDLNSKIPVLIEPMGYQAIMSGAGDKPALLEFLPKNHQLEVGSVVYTSGTGGIFFPGIPIGRVESIEKKFHIKFFSDLSQLYLVNVITSKPIGSEQ
ncbi:MAG: rod shape-determining protein MreC [Candidatus Pelagibacter sp.]|nr:rod shape-determining protein MreC [Candidatus Pelagibacter sp.]|tara:strand:+ start:220 stop:1071 length:852 start_codon:yes stop_codon:yes gene_type:complete